MKKIVFLLMWIYMILLFGCTEDSDLLLNSPDSPNICYFMEFEDYEGYTISYLGIPPEGWEPNYKTDCRSSFNFDFTGLVLDLTENQNTRVLNPAEYTLIIENAYPSEFINNQLGNYFDLSRMEKYVVKTIQSSEHTISWNGKNENGEICPTGFYKYTIISDNSSMSDYMLLLDTNGIPGWNPGK